MARSLLHIPPNSEWESKVRHHWIQASSLKSTLDGGSVSNDGLKIPSVQGDGAAAEGFSSHIKAMVHRISGGLCGND